LTESSDESETEEKPTRDWVRDRRKLRDDLNALDLSINYLRRKKDLNDMEKRVFYKMTFFDKDIQTDPIVQI
jgi:hypothetical protein